MIAIIRGHIRNSFETDKLLFFIHQLVSIYPEIKIYIHTWNIFSSNLSWRSVEQNNNIVTEEKIHKYFGSFSQYIKHILIDDDKQIKLIGQTVGKVCNSRCPIKGWKNYLYGLHHVNNFLLENKIANSNETIINFRFDLFDNSCKFTKGKILDFIIRTKTKTFNKNLFLSENEVCGIDNIFMGSIKTMHALSHELVNNLDRIIENNSEIINQEFLIFRTNNLIFSS